MRYGAPERLLVSEHFKGNQEWSRWCAKYGFEIEILTVSLFKKLCSLEHFEGPIALASTKQATSSMPSSAEGDLVYLDRIQDPGNLGTILRTCAALGVRQVALAPGTVWLWNSKVLRAGMSAHFSLLCFEDFGVSQLLNLPGFQFIATSGHEDRHAIALQGLDLRQPNAWCFGNEGAGVSRALLEAGGVRRCFIPQDSAVESLNVGAAAAICLYEQFRQRQSLFSLPVPAAS